MSYTTSGLSRADFLRLMGAGAGAAALGTNGLARAQDLGAHAFRSGGHVHLPLDVRRLQLNLGGRPVSTIGYNNVLPGPEIRLKRGDTLHAPVTNHLTDSTSVHWHGIPIVNSMDGVPNLTQKPISPGETFKYRWKAPVSGTYWYHSHSGLQNDRGLYGPLIIDEPNEPLSYDREYLLVLDDWRDVSRRFNAAEDLYECRLGPKHLTEAQGLPPTAPNRYPLYLINGQTPGQPEQFPVKRGEVVRLRIINAGAATVFRVAIEGHSMRVVHADGQAVKPVDVDVLEIGMAERYDVLIHANNPGVWQIAGWVNGMGVTTRAVLRYQGHRQAPPPASFKPRQLGGKLLTYEMLRVADGVVTPEGKPDLVATIDMKTRYGAFWLTWNGQLLDASQPIHIPRNKHIRFVLRNNGSTEIHPMHLHGNFFQVATRSGHGPMKDTLRVYPFQIFTVDWMSTNPGLWMFHCHNLYHMAAGMMLIFSVS